jgi:hypothetical protein
MSHAKAPSREGTDESLNWGLVEFRNVPIRELKFWIVDRGSWFCIRAAMLVSLVTKVTSP